MKKHSLVKVLTLLLLLVVIATYFIEGREGEVSYLALGDVFINYVQSFYYFFDTAAFILVVGGFYGLLNKTPAYKKMLDGVVSKFCDNGKKFVIISTIVFALLSAFTELNMLLLILIPFVVSIILLLGYDKLVALSSTVGAVVVGFIGGIFTTVKTSSGSSTFESLVGLEDKWGNIFPRILLFVLVVGLLILYICKYIKKLESDEGGYKLGKNDALFIETKDRNGKIVNLNYDGVKVWPLVFMLVVMLVLFVLGFMPWNSLFEITAFGDFHTWLTGLSIGNYTVFTSLISSNIPAFGEWTNLGNYMMAILIIAFFSLIIKLVYKIKIDTAIDAFVLGMKKMLPAMMVSMLAYTVLVCCYNNGFIETIITNAGDKFGDNVVVHSLITLLGSLINVDLYYVTAGVFSPIVSALSESANLSVYAIAFQGLYGLVCLVGPTSVLLIIGLTYLDVPYKTWIQYIWRFILELFIVIFVVMMIVSLL